MGNHMARKACDKITYPHSCTIEFGDGIGIFIVHYTTNVIDYPHWE